MSLVDCALAISILALRAPHASSCSRPISQGLWEQHADLRHSTFDRSAACDGVVTDRHGSATGPG
jgi:hypothetical protein